MAIPYVSGDTLRRMIWRQRRGAAAATGGGAAQFGFGKQYILGTTSGLFTGMEIEVLQKLYRALNGLWSRNVGVDLSNRCLRPLNRSKAVMLLVVVALMWSSAGVLIKLIPWHPLAIAGARSAIAVIVFFWLSKSLNLPDRPHKLVPP